MQMYLCRPARTDNGKGKTIPQGQGQGKDPEVSLRSATGASLLAKRPLSMELRVHCFRAKVGKPGPQRSTLDRAGVRAGTAASPAHAGSSDRSPAEQEMRTGGSHLCTQRRGEPRPARLGEEGCGAVTYEDNEC